MKIAACLFFIFAIIGNASSQFVEQWQQRYNGPANSLDVANAIAVDGSKNIYITGYSTGVGTSQDFTTVKYNPSGSLQWAARYSGFDNDIDNSNAITIDNSNNVIVTGFSLSNGTSYDYTTIKYDASGTELWLRKYNGTGNGIDKAKSIVSDDSGNVYISGESYGGSSTSYDFATVKYNPAGVLQWATRYNGAGNGNDGGNSIVIDNSHNVYVTGQSLGNGTNLDFTTIKYNSAGVQQWAMTYNGTANDVDASVKVLIDNQSNILVAGYSRGIGSSYDYAIVKYNSQGVQQWVYRFNGPQNGADVLTSAALDNAGNIYVTGVANSDVTGSLSNYATIKCNTSGNAQWVTYYNGPASNNDSATSIAINPSNDIFVTGKSMGTGTSFDYATIRYNSSGVQQSVVRYNGSGNSSDIPSAITIDNLGITHVTGTSIGSGSANDFITIEYVLMTGIQSNNNFNPDEFILGQNYPNPFNPNTIITYNIPANNNGQPANVKLVIFNALGNEVATLVNEEQLPGSYSVNFDGSNLSSGLYFYKITAGEFTSTKDMILLK